MDSIEFQITQSVQKKFKSSKYYGKLVRDKIPEIIQRNGEMPVIRILGDDEYLIELNRKLDEELHEYLVDENIEELADVLEVIYAIFKLKNISIDKMERSTSTRMRYISQLTNLTDEEYQNKLTTMLNDIVFQYQVDMSTDYLSDMLQLVYFISTSKGVLRDNLENIRKNKALKNGTFSEKIYLYSVLQKK